MKQSTISTMIATTTTTTMIIIVCLICNNNVVQANDDGLGLSPPLGWRSWNLYGDNVNQGLMQKSWTAWYNEPAKLMVSLHHCVT